MPTPTVSIGFSPTTPAPDSGYQNAIPRGDGGAPLLRESFEVPNTGIAVVKTANYTALAADCGKLLSFADSSPASAHTLTLPVTPPFVQWRISVQNTGTSTLTVSRNGLLIDSAAANLTLNQNSGVEIFTDGTNYFSERGVAQSPSGAANLVLATPDGSSGVSSLRALVAADIPSLSESKITNLTTDLAAKVPTSRTIATTAPLTGGGDLSADRTLAISAFTGDTGSGGAAGAVPAPPAGSAAAGKFLKADGTFAVPSSGVPSGAAGGDLGSTYPNPTVVATHLTAPLPVAQGGSGSASPSIVAGSGIGVTGSWPNQTIALDPIIPIQLAQFNAVQSASSTFSISTASAVQAGSTIVVEYYLATVPTITDSQGNTYTPYNAHTTGLGPTVMAQMVSVNVTGGAVITVTATGGGGGVLAIYEYRNVLSVDTSVSAFSNVLPLSSGTMTTTAPSDIIHMTGVYNNTTGTPSNGNSWPLIQTFSSSVATATLGSFSTTQGSPGAVSNTLSSVGISGGISISWVALLAFKPRSTTGVVTSVAVTVPSRQSVSGSPVTGAGTLGITDNTQSANIVFAGPSSGSPAVPTFRTLVSADLPSVLTNPMTTQGDIIYGGASGAPTRLAAGTSGNVLQTNGSSAAPTWVAPGGGGGSGALVLLEQHTASASAELDFTTWYSSAYDVYQIEVVNLVPVTNSVSIKLQMSTDGGATYDAGTNYGTADFRYIAGGTAAAGSAGGATAIVIGSSDVTLSNVASRGGLVSSFKLYNPGSTTVGKNLVGQGGYPATPGGTNNFLGNIFFANYNSTTAVNAFRIFASSGNLASGTVRIYGIAK